MPASNHGVSAHEALGEFVIVFQWVENIYRQIGWFILDPEREKWPPMQLRKETNQSLINKVTKLYVDLTNRYAFPNGKENANDMLVLQDRFHALRNYRNRLLHSTYIEFMSDGDVSVYIRSNPEIGVEAETGELIYDQEGFSAEVIYSKLREYSDDMFRLNIKHVQLIHWHPFHRYARGT
jgi:hypothetical protein